MRVRHTILRAWAGQRGANVAQSAAVALLAAALIGGILLNAPQLKTRVETTFACVAGVLGGGGADCVSGSGSNAQAVQPAAPTTLDELGGEGCDAQCQIIGVLKGFGEGGWDALKGLWNMGKDLFLLITGDEETWAKYKQLIEAFLRDPVGVARALLGELAAPIIEDWQAGRYGEATGRLLFEVISTIGGPKGLDKLAKLGKLDDLGDAGRVADRLPCVGAAPGGKAPGLAKPLAETCGLATKLRNTPGRASGGDKLPERVPGQRWLENPTGNGLETQIPKHIGKKLEGRNFNTFDDFREAFWKEVATDPDLSRQFSPSNRKLMEQGQAPIAPGSEHYGKHNKFILHHKTPIQHGGGVYDLDNIMIVSPKRHQNILDPGYHFGTQPGP